MRSSYSCQFPTFDLSEKHDARFNWEPGLGQLRPQSCLQELQDSFIKSEVSRELVWPVGNLSPGLHRQRVNIDFHLFFFLVPLEALTAYFPPGRHQLKVLVGSEAWRLCGSLEWPVLSCVLLSVSSGTVLSQESKQTFSIEPSDPCHTSRFPRFLLFLLFVFCLFLYF